MIHHYCPKKEREGIAETDTNDRLRCVNCGAFVTEKTE